MRSEIQKAGIFFIQLLIAGSLITACNSAKKPQTVIKDSVVVKSTTVTSAEPLRAANDSIVTITNPTGEKVMNTLYGTYDAKAKTSAWLCHNAGKLLKFKTGLNAKFLSQLLFADSVTTKGKKQFYVIISARPEGDDFMCHACAPVEEVFIFEKETTAWRLTYRKMFDDIGSYGLAPEFKLKKAGTDSYVFLVETGDMDQGISAQSVFIYSYYQGEFKSVLKLQDVGMDNTGACDDKVAGSCWDYNYTLTFANTPGNYNDIKLTKKGTEDKNGKTVPVDTVMNYQFAGGNYVSK